MCAVRVHAGVVLEYRQNCTLFRTDTSLRVLLLLCAVAGACTEPGITRWPSDDFHQAHQALRSRQLRCSCQSCNPPDYCTVKRVHYYCCTAVLEKDRQACANPLVHQHCCEKVTYFCPRLVVRENVTFCELCTHANRVQLSRGITLATRR